MPKKTKRQKILAELHRKLQAASSPKTQLVKGQNATSLSEAEVSPTPAFIYKKQAATKAKTHIAGSEFSWVKHDLKRVITFTFLAILLQGVIYFWLRTR